MTQVTRELIELAERVEKAEGADRELDAAIAVAALGFFECAPRWDGGPIGYGYIDTEGCRVEPGHGGMQLIREFTADLNAAMSLVPEGWRVASMGETVIEGNDPWNVRLLEKRFDMRGKSAEGDAATAALAITAASLRARSAATL